MAADITFFLPALPSFKMDKKLFQWNDERERACKTVIQAVLQGVIFELSYYQEQCAFAAANIKQDTVAAFFDGGFQTGDVFDSHTVG